MLATAPAPFLSIPFTRFPPDPCSGWCYCFGAEFAFPPTTGDTHPCTEADDMYGYAIWDGETDWFRTNPSTRSPLVYWDLKKLKSVREKLIQAGVPPQRVQPVE